MGENIKLDQIVERLPNEWAEDLIPKIIQILKDESFRLAVIDDDPAGTQTVSDVTIMNKWNYDSILKQFNVSYKALFFKSRKCKLKTRFTLIMPKIFTIILICLSYVSRNEKN